MTSACTHPASNSNRARNREAARAGVLSRFSLLSISALVLLASCAGSNAPTSGTGAAGAAADAAQPLISLRVMAFNDFHGNLEAGSLNLSLSDPRSPGASMRVATGGAAALAGLAARLKADAPHSVLVSSGDMIGATPLVSALFMHEPTIEAMNLAGVDVGTVGNHEFDAGSAELQRIMRGGCAGAQPDANIRSCPVQNFAGARFPLIAANVLKSDGQPLLAPSWIYRIGSVKVGFIGAITQTTPQLVVASGIAGLQFSDEAQAINRSVQALKAQGVEALIVTLHEGGEIGAPGQPADWNDTRCPNLRGAIVDIAERISPDVDLILTAHTHQGYNCVIKGRHVMQAVSYGRGLSVADLKIDPRTGDVVRSLTVARNLPVLNERTDPAQRQALAAAEPANWGRALQEAKPVPAIAELVQRYAKEAAPQAQRVVGRIAQTLDRRGRVDTAAGRMIADAQWAATRDPAQGGSDFALMNAGGVRTDLECRSTPPCNVTYGELFSMQPFGNSLVVMTLTGAQIKTLLEEQQRSERDAPSFMSPSSGLSYRWNSTAALGQRVQDLRLNGQPIQAERAYRVTVNSFMAEGGDGFATLKAGRQRVGGAQDLDATLSYFKTQVPAAGQARITWAP